MIPEVAVSLCLESSLAETRRGVVKLIEEIREELLVF
jgi:hypothetical protein